VKQDDFVVRAPTARLESSAGALRTRGVARAALVFVAVAAASTAGDAARRQWRRDGRLRRTAISIS
jgi:hypothetical protein